MCGSAFPIWIFQERDMDTAGTRDPGRILEELVERYKRPLLAIAYRYTFDWESSKDLCQDTWLRVYRKLSGYDGRVPFERWLFAVHRNICFDYLRKRKRRKEVTGERIELLVSGGPGPEEEAELAETRRRILDAASRLPERQRSVFAMIDLEQMTAEEAAGVLGIKTVSIRTNLYHARKAVARALRGSEERR
jgi:RNA polymerase sigma-70 factor (ECF subfamily)